MSLRNRYTAFLEMLHVKIFGVSVGDATRLFIGQLHWSIAGGVVASGILLVISILAGRVLGVEEYGRYSFMIALAYLISLAMTLGFELAIVRGLSVSTKDALSQQSIISSVGTFLIVSALVVNTIVFFLPLPFEKGILMALATVIAMKLLFDSMIRGLGLFEHQAIGKMIEGVAVALCFVLAIAFDFFDSHTHYLLVMLGGSVAAMLWYLKKLRPYGSFSTISYPALQMLWSYGSIAIIGSVITTIVGFATKFTISYFLGYEFLGQFTAYYMGSIAALAFLGGLIINVVFPLAAREEYHDALWHKMHRMFVVSFLPFFLCTALATNIAIFLYGPSYYLSWWFGIAMAFVSVVQFWCSMYFWLIASKGVSGIRYASLHTAIAGGIYVVLLALTIPHIPLLGIVLGYGGSSAYMIWSIRSWRSRVPQAKNAKAVL